VLESATRTLGRDIPRQWAISYEVLSGLMSLKATLSEHGAF
jgi:hypothetical protein